jgi:fatty acid-binding protein DegV
MIRSGQQAFLGADAWCVEHTRSPRDAGRLAERLGVVFDSQPEFMSEIGPVVGTHIGPGGVGIGTMPARFLEHGSDLSQPGVATGP